MNPATSKAKWKKHGSAQEFGAQHYAHDEFRHDHATRPKEKQGKRKFKIQREVDDYLLSIH